MKQHKISSNSAHSDNCYFHFFQFDCLIELKFCEVLQNYVSYRCWKFQLSILKNKNVLFLKNIWSKPKSLNRPREFQQMAFAVPIFSEGFGWSSSIKIWRWYHHRFPFPTLLPLLSSISFGSSSLVKMDSTRPDPDGARVHLL